MKDCLVLTYKENGIRRGLYRGLSLNYLRAMPMAAVSFTTYEFLKTKFNIKENAIKFKTG